MKANIKLVNQDDDKSCVGACLAMVSGYDLEFIREHLGSAGPFGLRDIVEHARKLNLETNLQVFPTLLWNRVYMVKVPSLNFPAINHQIVITTLNYEMEVFDPQQMNGDRKWYSDISSGDNIFEVKCWSECVEIIYNAYNGCVGCAHHNWQEQQCTHFSEPDYLNQTEGCSKRKCRVTG